MNADLAQIYYGTRQEESRGRTLSAGAWSAVLIDGALRDVRFEGVEVIRAIAYVVRDRDWGTCRPAMSGIEIDEHAGGFRVAYAAEIANPDGHRLTYSVEIEATNNDGLTFRSRASAQTAFLTARCGFCVLHPIDGVAGAPARVEHGDGTVEESAFPVLIDPWQPFKDIRSIEHTRASGLRVRCRLTGDVFEMEDQRNWSDASFKTYSRPLELPWPYLLEAGRTTEQAVSLSVDGASPRLATRGNDNATIDIDSAGNGEPMFALGIAVAPDETDAVLSALPLLAELGPQQLTLHFDPLAGHSVADLARFAQLQRDSSIPAVLEFALPGIDAPHLELQAVAAQIDEARLVLAGVMVSPSVHRQSNPPGSVSPPCPPLDEVYREARRAFPGVRLGGGMLSYFTELNRKRPPLDLVDWVTHATCPIVHAADDVSVMETLETLPHITRSCRALIGTQPYAIGPISIGMRQNPYGSRVMPNPRGERIAMTVDDPRQRGLFGAAWLAGYAAALGGAALEHLTLGAFVGPRGLIDSSSTALARYPVFHVAAALARMAGEPLLRCESTRARDVACFGTSSRDGTVRLVMANLTAERRTVRVRFAKGLSASEQVNVTTLDEQTIASRRPARTMNPADEFVLRPFGCVEILSGSASSCFASPS
ncbi:hypothetical protein B0G81_8571 [Paraburkholderia sp. BL6665CI2N2]|uniref:D-apionate lactonase n=1 Tax=Paraburkholderia sp. BL6665CI2N2 TaxID=1938806 RepID=UPI0010E78079|nr:hypothetical protein [Paraburkholderia sp. BL6665CI2N2]TDY15522.1 hypothetical protein B0G81_8571 [Paraburkholderia sp. BL6665CI2N2]